MSVSIKYTANINLHNNDVVIFVSSLSQLKNIDFIPNADFYLKDKEFIKYFESNNIFTISNSISKNNSLINIYIVLINSKIKDIIQFGSHLYSYLSKFKFKNVIFSFSDIIYKKNKVIFSDLILGFCIKSYKFEKYKTGIVDKKNTLFLHKIKEFKELKYNLNLLNSINYCKDLISEPANILTPITYSKKCEELKKIGLKVTVLDKSKLEKIGMNSLLAVSQGSINEPRVVILEWNVNNINKPSILVGKGVTFDSGGLSLKPSGGMEEMIQDMGGSAVVVSSLINAALNKSSKSIVGIIGLVENMPDGNAYRPGDIVKSLSGQTIEVLNTDAEGRMVLADILTYIQKKYKPKYIIDFATLTGAIMIALGTHRAGLFSNNDNLSNKLENASIISGEKIWRMPIGREYDHEINSSRADMKNIGTTRFGGSIQAAQFIYRFIENDIPWAHLDIAGVSWSSKSSEYSFTKLHSPGATAFGVRLIDQFLKG